MCSGTLKKGGNCVKNATTVTPALGMMPTCKIHQKQQMPARRCQACLRCGFECGRLFPWEPHGFRFCIVHRRDLKICYFFNIPEELRLCVYRFLLPDKIIPARYGNSRHLKTNGERVYTAILRVNKQIHEEVIGLLYRTTFTIVVSGNRMKMCNLTNEFALRPVNQIQRMLLKQQNTPYACGPTEILWHPPLSKRYFDINFN